MTTNFIPNRDTEFDAWANSFLSSVKDDAAAYGLTADDITALQDETTAWDSSFGEMFQKRDSAKAATVNKEQKRQVLEQTIRNFARQIQADPNVSNTLKADAGLPVHATTRTPVPVPNTAPVAVIDSCNVQEQEIKFSDTANPGSRVRPRGVMGVEVWGFAGDEPPLSDEQYNMLAMSTRMSTTISFTGEQAGKTAYYRFRFINNRGEVGPWSMVYTSTINK